MTETLVSLKIALIFILVAIMYSGLVPAYSKHCRSSQYFLSFLNCFAGGVFLAMAFIHILPEAAHTYTEAMAETTESARLLSEDDATSEAESEHEGEAELYPLPYLLFMGGYCVVLFIDRVFAGHFGHSHDHGHSHNHSHKKNKNSKEVVDIHGTHAHHDHHGFHNNCNVGERQISNDSNECQVENYNPEQAKDIENIKAKHSEIKLKENAEIKQGNHSPNTKLQTERDVQEGESIIQNQGKANAGDSEKQVETDKKVKLCGVDITPLILLLALGFHSIFEGIALGLIKDVKVFINLMIGVAIHHIAASISLGVSLGQHNTQSKLAIFFIFFGLSLIESIGIAIGLGLNEAPELVSSIILSIAGGTFVYIACSEILVHEFANQRYRYVKFVSFILGCALISCLWFLNKDH